MFIRFLGAAALTTFAGFALSSPSFAQDTQKDPHAGHNHPEASTMSPEELAKIDYIYTQSPDDHVTGDAAAPNTLIVYASVTCPHCADWFSNQLPILQKKLINKGKMKMVFREFPTGPVQVSMAGFQLANCAPDEKYFDVLQYQMENQKETFDALGEGKAIERFLEIAKVADITTQEDMFACFDNKDGFERVEEAMSRARAAKLTGVPALILNGKVIDGPSDAASITALLP